MVVKMIPQIISALLLFVPLITIIISSIPNLSRSKKMDKSSEKIQYKKKFLFLVGVGWLSIWPIWIGSFIFLFLNNFYIIFGILIFSTHFDVMLQIIGFFIFYIGDIMYNLIIIFNSKYIIPSTSELSKNHRLIQKGPYKIVRHPLYVSYLLILVGLSLILLIYWLLIPAIFIIIGVYPTAKTEEEFLIQKYGEEYIKYKRNVGMFFPKFKKVKSIK